MEEDWDSENFAVKEPVAVGVAVSANKWEGEDEDDDVKDSWDAEEEEEEEKKDVEKIEQKTKQKPKKNLAEKIAEKERLRLEEIEKKMKEKEEEVTPEERLRRQKESDLQLALETTFGDGDDNGIDGMNPTTQEEFLQLSEALNKKLLVYSKNPEFPVFAEDHVRNICAALTSADIKKLKTTIDNIYIEKQKIEKGDKARKNKGKGKAKLRVEGDNTKEEYSAFADSYDYDDFM